MKPAFILCSLLLLLAAASGAHAQELVLDLEEALELARRNNLGLASARIDLRSADRAARYRWNELLPSVTAGLGLNRTGTEFTPDDSPWNLSASLRASLPLSGETRYSMARDRLLLAGERFDLEETSGLLVRDVKKAFYLLIILEERVRLIQEYIETARNRYERARINYENGLVSEITMLTALVNLENLRPDLENARLDRRVAELELKQLLGIELDTQVSVTGEIETMPLPDVLVDAAGAGDFDTAGTVPEGIPEAASAVGTVISGEIEQAIRERPDVLGLVNQVQVLENTRRLTRAQEFGPVLSLSLSHQAAVNDPFGGGWGDGSRSTSFGLAVSVPIEGLVPGSPGRQSIAEVDDSIEQAGIDLDQAVREARVEITTAVLELQTSLRVLEVLEQNAELARRTYQLAEQEFEAGLEELSTLEEAYDDLQEAELQILEERFNYLSGLFDLEYAVNIDLDGVQK
jgi:outer membrane protein TolC